MSGSVKKLLHAAAGTAAGGDPVYVEDVFSTHLYNGNSGSQSINNGIDLAGEGGLVWIKSRKNAADHALYDTERNSNNVIHANDSAGQDTNTPLKNDTSNAFTSTGFDLNTATGITNNDNYVYTSWAFRKQTGFFDVVKWTGTGGNLTLSHNLGCVPGMILIKNAGGTHSWKVYHVGTHSTNPANFYLVLDGTNAAASANNAYFQQTAPTATNFYVGSNADCNENGQTMIAYLFAGTGDSASQIFGDNGDEAIIKTGSYTGSGAVGKTITLGFEPQWMLIKNADNTTPWVMIDNMRGMPVNGEGVRVLADQSAAEVSSASYFAPRADGVEVTLQNTYVNTSGETYIYMAIRRGPMKEPTAGTDVYKGVTGTNSAPAFVTGMPVDWAIRVKPTSPNTTSFQTTTRLINPRNLNVDDGSNGFTSDGGFDFQNGFLDSTNFNSTWFAWNFRRFPKVFDHIAYKGTNGGGSASSYVDTHPHNLGVKPEMIIIRATDNSAYSLNWEVWHTGLLGSIANLADDSAAANGLSDSATSDGVRFRDHSTASVIGRTNSIHTNSTSHNYIGFLFASLSGISAVNKYTGTGNDINVTDLGAAARFVLIKRVDSSGSWYVYDSTRGIASGNDPYLLWDLTSAEVTNTDYIDPHSSGFTITSSAPAGLNTSGGTYIYLAFA